MKNWGSLGVTNALLLIIAIFLMILVVNSSPNASRSNPHAAAGLSQMGSVPPMSQPDMPEGTPPDQGDAQPPQNNPHGNAPAANSDSFNVENMAFAALKCPSDGTVSLGDQNCKGAEAKKRQDFVMELATQNLPPRLLFDKIIEKYGEAALTDEAREIRKNNRSR